MCFPQEKKGVVTMSIPGITCKPEMSMGLKRAETHRLCFSFEILMVKLELGGQTNTPKDQPHINQRPARAQQILYQSSGLQIGAACLIMSALQYYIHRWVFDLGLRSKVGF